LKDLGVGIVGYCRELLDAVDLLCVDASAMREIVGKAIHRRGPGLWLTTPPQR
jgi:hypothetical protein